MNTQVIDRPAAGRSSCRILVSSGGTVDPLFATALSALGTVQPDGGKAQDGDLLVLDAASLPAAAFAAHAKKAAAALAKNQPVLVLRPTRAHKAALAGHGALHHYADGDSCALLIEPRRDPAGALRIALAEQLELLSSGIARLVSVDDSGAILQSEATGVESSTTVLTPDDLAPFVERVRTVVERLASGQTIPIGEDFSADGGFGQPNQPPPSIPSSLWNATPVTLFQPMSFTSPYKNGDGSTIPTGTATWQALVTVGVYYDNTSFSTPVQWAFVEHSGSLSLPYNAKTQNGLQQQNDRDEGWSIGMLSVLGTDISRPGLVSNQSSPDNANNTTSYTSSSSFQVGLSAGTDGLSGNATYQIGSSVTNDITEWTVQKNGPNNWVFFQQTPYDGRNTSSFPSGSDGHRGAPKTVPTISAGDLDFCTQTVWIQSPAVKTSLVSSYTYPMNLFWYHVDSRKPIRWSATMNYWNAYYAMNFVINFGLAYPAS